MKTEKKDFIKVPWAFWKSVSTKMDYIEGYIFLYLAQYCYGSKTECFPTQKTISFDTGIPLVTVKRKIKSMVQRGVLDIIKTNRNDKPKWNTYRLTEWDQIAFCVDRHDAEQVNKSMDSSNETLHSVTEKPAVVSQRDIKKINRRILIQEDKFVADATSSSNTISTTVSSGNRGEAPMYDPNTMNANSISSAAPYASSAYDEMMANKDFVAKLNNGTLTEAEHDQYLAACENKYTADEEEKKQAENERRRKLTINQLIEEDVNPPLAYLPSNSSNESLFNAIWNYFKNKPDSYRYKRTLYALKLDSGIFTDPLTHDSLTEKEVLIRSQAMLKHYWKPEHWFGDGSLMMFIINYKEFYTNISWMRWNLLEEYCRENSYFLAKKCIKENRLLSLSNNQEVIKEILDSGIEVSELQRNYLTSDPTTIEYNCVGVLRTNQCMIRDYERDEISIETFKTIFSKI